MPAILGVLLLAAACASAPDALQTERELLAIQDEWATARIKGDVPYLEKLYAPEFYLQVMDGSVNTRAADIAMFERVRDKDPDAIQPQSINDVDMKVTAYGDTAIVTGVENLKGSYRGFTSEFVLRFTNVFVRLDGRWQLVLHHSTPVQNQQRAPSQ
jgi:ketosteroid isomerase-like protein